MGLPGIAPEICFALKEARCLEKLASPNIHVFSAVDTTVDRIVEYSVRPMDNPLGEESGRAIGGRQVDGGERHDLQTTRDARRDFCGVIYPTEGKEGFLDLLATLPEYQGKGVRTKLLEWGIQVADARNARIYVSRSHPGGIPALPHVRVGAFGRNSGRL
ncbi:hypothetical protein BDV28DRAFT_79475 [Aspergillus coremiiformis]|uniref:N-acetyltransferase domain-containing protein n=1 Tax=Aspergillus coremiiformis TaxID=138285 RepID=A0A5N6ZA55_9EURO|nr:hypothetical protein BDV28DRAFT_79475 [Aspergillus coremiiformis]